MQRVTSLLPSWDRTKSGSKKGFDTAWKWADKLGAPINRLSNKIGSEAFWPTTLDKESDKAARILKSFCKDGFYAEEDRPSPERPKGKQRVLKKIPEKVIQNAVGLAIFTTMRTGLWVSGAGGSGVLVARKEDGEWSPPSGIMLHTAGLGFLVGVDIYDCVVVINNRKALEAFTKIRATLGGEISAVAGPVGVGGVLENDGKWKQANRPVFTYLKSRGFYAGVQVDGTVVIERTDENERFYGEKIGVADILAGKARHPPNEIKMLMETVKAAEGRNDVDQGMMNELATQPAPGDVDVESPTARSPTFGLPEPDDPDPFGVLALEKAGLEIREAGSKSRPPSSQFEYNPSPTSPIFGRFNRRSMDTLASRSNRGSFVSRRTSVDRGTQTMEMGTQTDDFLTPNTSPSHSDENKRIVEEDETPTAAEETSKVVHEPPVVVEPDYTVIENPFLHLINKPESDTHEGVTTDSPEKHEEHATRKDGPYLSDKEDEDEEEEEEEGEEEEEEPVIFEAASAQATMIAPQAIKARGGLVTIPKRGPPPPLPARSMARGMMVDSGSGRSPGRSPLRTEFEFSPLPPNTGGFEEVALHGGDRRSMEVPKSSDVGEVEALYEKEESVHKDAIVPHVDEPSPKVDMLRESGEVGEKLGLEEDQFHSVPTTPNQHPQAVQVI